MNLIQQKRRKEVLTDEQASSWNKAINSIQQNARKNAHGRTSFQLKESNELNSAEWKKGNAQERTSF